MSNCKPVNIPTVDNTELPCGEYINDECIIREEPILFIGSPENSSLETIINLMVEKMKKQQQLIINLRAEIETLLNT